MKKIDFMIMNDYEILNENRYDKEVELVIIDFIRYRYNVNDNCVNGV